MARKSAVQRAIDFIPDDAWTPVKYPGSVRDPNIGGWISDADFTEPLYTAYAFTPHPVTARLIVRRVKDAAIEDALFPVWRHHPFFTNTTLPTTTADVTHRAHAIALNRLLRSDRRTSRPHAVRHVRRESPEHSVQGGTPTA